jgi:hypothetical protein
MLGDIVIISVSGELDVSNKAEAKAALANGLAKAFVSRRGRTRRGMDAEKSGLKRTAQLTRTQTG